MTTSTSLFLAALIAGFLVIDAFAYNWDMSLFLARKFTDLLLWAAFWR